MLLKQWELLEHSGAVPLEMCIRNTKKTNTTTFNKIMDLLKQASNHNHKWMWNAVDWWRLCCHASPWSLVHLHGLVIITVLLHMTLFLKYKLVIKKIINDKITFYYMQVFFIKCIHPTRQHLCLFTPRHSSQTHSLHLNFISHSVFTNYATCL